MNSRIGPKAAKPSSLRGFFARVQNAFRGGWAKSPRTLRVEPPGGSGTGSDEMAVAPADSTGSPQGGGADWSALLWRWLAPALYAVLTLLPFPPFDFPEAAYLFLLPVLFWATKGPDFRIFIRQTWLFSVIAWTGLLHWVSFSAAFATPGQAVFVVLGTLVLGGLMGSFPALWLIAARAMLPPVRDQEAGKRILVVLGLAGLWVVIEWIRSWLLSGFPWLPLAASQWQRPVLLQMASLTGAWGVSFTLVFFNLGLTAYLYRLIRKPAGPGWRRQLCPEFYLALGLLLFGGFGVLMLQSGGRDWQPLGHVVAVQPAIEQPDKWDSARADEVLATVANQTRRGMLLEPDLILWPESVTPFPIDGNDSVRRWTESLASEAGVPILMGNLARKDDGGWANIACVVYPEAGYNDAYYAKRRLLPFGEFMPFEERLGWLDKIVPLPGSFQPGTAPVLLPVRLQGRNFRAGPLICYEDIFPRLARETVAAGADFLYVATNDGWFGESAMPFQHAAHSVLRAVETRRPVLRCGNSGWSGWIDEYGNVRDVLRAGQGAGTIFFRGAGSITVQYDRSWRGRETFYVRHGDWFVVLSALLALAGTILARMAVRAARA